MEKIQKQDAGKQGSGTTRENFNADELAQQGSYQDSTEVAQQMREGDKTESGTETHNDVDGGRGVKGDRRSNQK
jgi:hypothetical protein